MLSTFRKKSIIEAIAFSCLIAFSFGTISCKKKSQAIRVGVKTATSKMIKKFATYAFGIAFLMRTEEILAEKMFETFTSEPTKTAAQLGQITIYNNHPQPISIDITKDGKNWEAYSIPPRDSISINPNHQGLAFISSESPDNTFVRLEPNKEYAVKVEDNQKVVDEIQRKEK